MSGIYTRTKLFSRVTEDGADGGVAENGGVISHYTGMGGDGVGGEGGHPGADGGNQLLVSGNGGDGSVLADGGMGGLAALGAGQGGGGDGAGNYGGAGGYSYFGGGAGGSGVAGADGGGGGAAYCLSGDGGDGIANSNGGQAGPLNSIAGAGGTGNGAGYSGGAGGSVLSVAGVGGVGESNADAGYGGYALLKGGDGGYISSGTGTPSYGGYGAVFGGDGGVGTGTEAGGDGGDANIDAGAGGVSGGAGAGTDGDVNIGENNAANINLGSGSTLINLAGSLYVPTIFGASSTYLRFGDASTTSHGLSTEDQVLFTGIVEFDSVAYFDNDVVAAASLTFGSLAAGFRSNAAPTVDSLSFFVDNTSRTAVLTDFSGRVVDTGHAGQANATFFIHSANNNTTEWISACHDQTHAVINWGTGRLDLAGGGVQTDIIFGRSSTYLRFGDATTTSHGFSTEDQVLFTSDVEIDGATWCDSTLTVGGTATMNGVLWANNSLYINDFTYIRMGSSSDSSLGWSNTQTNHATLLGVGNSSNTFIICQEADKAFDFAHGDQTNPTIIGHSANQATDEWWSLTHDQTNAVFDWGTGLLDFAGGSATVSTVTHDEYWEVQIGGVTKKIMLGS